MPKTITAIVAICAALTMSACGGGGSASDISAAVAPIAQAPAVVASSPATPTVKTLAVSLVGDNTLDAERMALPDYLPEGARVALNPVRVTVADQRRHGLQIQPIADTVVIVLSFGTEEATADPVAWAADLTAVTAAAKATGAAVVIEGPLSVQPHLPSTAPIDAAVQAIAAASGSVYCSRNRPLRQTDQPDGVTPVWSVVQLNAAQLSSCIRNAVLSKS